jgi:catechol 2,3-dioxygenase-like lactoylglutathione lyase family enzyme
LVEGLSHVTFIVSDLERTSRFLEAVFGAREVYRSGEDTFSLSREKFFLIGELWIAIMEGEALAERTYNHVAFKIPEAAFDDYVARVRASGAAMKEPRPRVEGEGRSVYFYDFDNHLFELHTGTLEQRLARYCVRADPTAAAEATEPPRT